LALQPVEGGIERTLVHLQLIARRAADPLHDRPAVGVAELQCLQHQQVQCSGDEISLERHGGLPARRGLSRLSRGRITAVLLGNQVRWTEARYASWEMPFVQTALRAPYWYGSCIRRG